MPLVTSPNLTAPDDFYEALVEAHRDLSTEESHSFNARLILVLANQVGDVETLREALRAARARPASPSTVDPAVPPASSAASASLARPANAATAPSLATAANPTAPASAAADMKERAFVAFVESVLATAQAGETFSKDPFDLDRFARLKAAAAELLAGEAGVAPATVASWIDLDKDYPTPKLDVRAFIVDDLRRILLVRERVDDRWSLPGGWCDIGDSPSGAAEREVFEETGLTCRARRLLALFDKRRHPHPPQLPHAFKAFFLCDVEAGVLRQDTPETHGAAYFPIDALPPLSEHRVLASQLAALHRQVDGDDREALFD